MSTQCFVTAILLLGAVACGGSEDDTPLTQPTTVARPTTGAPVPASDIVGDYRVTFAASASCSLPTEFMKRTYNANVRAWVGFPQVAVHVSGAPFYRDGAVGFEGMRDGNTVRFTIVGVADELAYILGSVPGLAEVIDQTTWLTYDGTAVAHIAANHITGTFDGLIKLRDATSDATLVECRATDHKMEFVR